MRAGLVTLGHLDARPRTFRSLSKWLKQQQYGQHEDANFLSDVTVMMRVFFSQAARTGARSGA